MTGINKIILAGSLLFCPILASDFVDLSNNPVYVREGFRHHWTTIEKPEDEKWHTILPTDNTPRLLSIRDIPIASTPKHIPFNFSRQPDMHFTYIIPFSSDSAISSYESVSLFLASIAYNWEIYLNGSRIENEIHLDVNGRISQRLRARHHMVTLPKHILLPNENILTFHIVGNPADPETGFYLSKPYLIGNTHALYQTQWGGVSLVLLVLYILGFFFWLFLFIRQNSILYYIYLSLFSASMALYHFARAFLFLPEFSPFTNWGQLEHVSLFFAGGFFLSFVDRYIRDTNSVLSIVLLIYSSIFSIFSTLAPFSVLPDILRLWQLTIPLFAVYILIFVVGRGVVKSLSKWKKSKPLSRLLLQDPTGQMVILLPLVIGIFLKDVIHSFQERIIIDTLPCGLIVIVFFMIHLNQFIRAQHWTGALERQAEEQTQKMLKTRSNIEAIFHTSGDGIARFDSRLYLLECNKAFTDMFGYTKEEFNQMELQDFYDKKDLDLLLRYKNLALKDGHANVELRAKHKHGHYINLSVTATPMFDESGYPKSFVVNMKDITKEVLAEKQLREAKENMEAIFTALPDLYFRVDKTGTYLEQHGPDELLYPPGISIVGMNINDRLPPAVAKKIMNGIKSCLKNKQRKTIEYSLDIDGKPMRFEASILPFRKGEIVAGVRDITERHALLKQQQRLIGRLEKQQEQLRRLSHEAVQIQEQERTRISRELHDEIGQAMTAVSLTLKSIRQTNVGEPNLTDSKLSECQELVQTITNDIRQFAQELRPTTLDDLGVLPAMKSLGKNFSEQTQISVDFSGDDNIVLQNTDSRTVLYRVFQESLTNVVKHAGANKVFVQLSKENGWVNLMIQDNGSGFKNENVYDSKRGIGLLGMQERVEGVGGHISIDTAPGKGTKIFINIPDS